MNKKFLFYDFKIKLSAMATASGLMDSSDLPDSVSDQTDLSVLSDRSVSASGLTDLLSAEPDRSVSSVRSVPLKDSASLSVLPPASFSESVSVT